MVVQAAPETQASVAPVHLVTPGVQVAPTARGPVGAQNPPSDCSPTHVPSLLPNAQVVSMEPQMGFVHVPEKQAVSGSGQFAVMVHGYSQYVPGKNGSLTQSRPVPQAVAGHDSNSLESTDVSVQPPPVLPPLVVPPLLVPPVVVPPEVPGTQLPETG